MLRQNPSVEITCSYPKILSPLLVPQTIEEIVLPVAGEEQNDHSSFCFAYKTCSTLEFTETQPLELGRVEDDDNLSLQFPTGSVFATRYTHSSANLGGKRKKKLGFVLEQSTSVLMNMYRQGTYEGLVLLPSLSRYSKRHRGPTLWNAHLR